jgi:hypothetical protein
MGPYVYLEGQQLGLTTLLCRCSPAQADRWFVDLLYQLVRIQDLDELGLGPRVSPHLGLSSDPARLQHVLRWPPAE